MVTSPVEICFLLILKCTPTIIIEPGFIFQTKMQDVRWDMFLNYGCYAPEEIYKSNKLANVFYNSSEGLSTPVTSSLMPPKPARTERRLYSWRNSGKREVCMYVRILDPLEFRNNYKKESDDKFNAECSEGGKDVTSSSHSNRKRSKSSKSMTVGNSGNSGINSYNNKYHEIKIKNNLASKGKKGEERDEALRLPDIIKREGKMTSPLHNTVAQRQQQPSSLDARVAEQYKSRHISSRSSSSLGFRKALQSYDKIAAMLFMCFGIIMQLSEAFSPFARCKSKRLIGNSRKSLGGQRSVVVLFVGCLFPFRVPD